MRPHLDGTGFGWIEIEGVRHGNDVLIRLDGTVEKRKKKLSKQIYGTSHTISLGSIRQGAPLGGGRRVLPGIGGGGAVAGDSGGNRRLERCGRRLHWTFSPDLLSTSYPTRIPTAAR